MGDLVVSLLCLVVLVGFCCGLAWLFGFVGLWWYFGLAAMILVWCWF